MSMNIQYFYMTVGRTGAMYTLREVKGNGRDIHIQNLGRDAERAFKKAYNFAQQHNAPLKTSLDDLSSQLRAIKRSTKKEREERKKAINEHIQKRRAEVMRVHKKDLDNQIMPVGKYSGSHFKDIPRGYLEWITNQEYDKDSIMDLAAAEVLEYIMNDPLPVPNPNSVTGKVKERCTFNVTCIGSRSFDRPSWNGLNTERVNVTTMVDDEGNCLVCFSTSFKMEVKEQKRIKATIKEHTIYNNQAQTVVQRVKKIE